MRTLSRLYNRNIVMLFFILLPFVEVITTITITYTKLAFTLGMIYKTAFIAYSVIYLLFLCQKNKKFNLTTLAIIAVYCIVNCFITAGGISVAALFTKFTTLARYICFPVTVLFLYNYLQENYISLKVVLCSATLYGLCMFIAGLSSTAFASYSSGLAYGHSGWFNSGNELSALLSMFLPLTMYFMAKSNKILPVLAFMLVNYGLLVIGTKTSLVSIAIITFVLLLCGIVQYFRLKDKIYKNIIQICVAYIFFIAIIVPHTPAYSYMIERFNTSAVDENGEAVSTLDTFIYNGREIDLQEQLEAFLNAPIKEQLFGLNDNTKSLVDSGAFNVIERDFYDILFIHGLVGIGLFFAPIITIALYAIVNLIKKKDSLYTISLLISIIMGIGISYIAGHVFLASTVAIFFAFIVSKLILHDEENVTQKMVIYIPKISTGGMERSLINMLNASAILNEYNVTLVIGYVTDKELLKDIPSHINTRLLCSGKWNTLGKIEAAFNYLIELLYIVVVEYDIAICYSYHHQVLSILTRLASEHNILFMHTDLINSRTKEEIDRLNKNVEFERFKAIVCVSNAAKISMEKLYPHYSGKMVVINNYIDGNIILKNATEAVSNKKKKHEAIFINVSRHFERAKKISRIIEAASKLKLEGYKFKVWLVGDGESTASYKEQIVKAKLQDTIELLGRQNNPYKYMTKADYLVISSDFEGYGIVIDEARVLKLPIISTDIADAKEIIPNKYGVVCENSTQGVYDGMKQALDGKVSITSDFNFEQFNNVIDNDLKKLFDELLLV